MKQFFFYLVPAVLLYSCSSPENISTANRNAPRVDSIFSTFSQPGSPGCAVVVFQGDQIIFSKGYGLADIEHNVPISSDATVFDIASVSKQFTAYAAARLVEQGKISLSDDIRTYFPELKDFTHTITVDQLIHHTSGLRDWPQTLAVAGWSMEDELTYDQILRMAFRQTDLNYEPGAEYTYTNTGYVLLAELVSRVAGEPFHEHIKNVIYEPIGMNSSLFNHDIHTIVPNRALSYYQAEGNSFINYANNTTAMGSSSMMATAEDLAKWLMFLAKSKDSDPVVKRLHERGVLNNGDSLHYAFGIWFEESGGLPVITHTGSWAGFRAITMRFPTEDFGLVILSNYGNFDRYQHAEKLAKAFLGDNYLLPQHEENKKAAEAAPLAIAGVYLSSPTRIYEIGDNENPTKLLIDGAIEHLLSPDSLGGYFVAGEPTWQLSGDSEQLLLNGKPLTKITSAPLSMASYEGSYFSEELQATYQVKVDDGVLTVANIKHGAVSLEPIAGHLFAGSEWFMGRVLFTTANGKVSGFQVFGGRVRRLHFKKVS